MQQVIRSPLASALMALMFAMTTASANAAVTKNENTIDGVYRSVDDKTGFSRGLTEVVLRDGVLHGTIIKTIPRPNYAP